MTRGEPPNQEAFDKLLFWLDPDRDKAGEKYERIRVRLIRILEACGAHDAEDLADSTINVVVSKTDWLIANYEGDQALYFYAVAKKKLLEYRKKKPPPIVPPPDPTPPEFEKLQRCLDQGLQELTSADRELALKYQEGEKQERIQNRKKLAAEQKLTLNALRIKVCHIHARLRQSIEQRLSQFPDD